jgi:hypothetical protein
VSRTTVRLLCAPGWAGRPHGPRERRRRTRACAS